ncbi:MAG TPA: MBL fold metallo-hydrolase [Dehalococcoidia bacterium]|nr:MBL fold metallo-hydrolase [Dehalococcoidia bacterium]
MAIRITTLSENTASNGEILAEWGLSILIETGQANILFDTGKSISAGHNADTLGVDLGKVDKIVLSHSHGDHTGGLKEILRKMRKEVEIVAHPDVWDAKYARRPGEADRYIGIPSRRYELENMGARFHLTREPVTLAENIMTTGEVPMVTDYEKVDSALFIKVEAGWQPDTVADDQAIIISTPSGLVVILGCAHRGIINTLYHAQKLTGTDKIHTVIGGSHLLDANEERLWLTIAALRELDAPRLGLCHCTGQSAACLLAQEFGEGFFFNRAGTITDLT